MTDVSHDRSTRNTRSLIVRILTWALGIFASIALLGYIAFQVSPWPGVFLIRHAFSGNSVSAAEALQKHVPPGIAEQLNVQYDTGDKDALLDIFYPSDAAAAGKKLPTIVWIHGGAWVSGTKDDLANYARILAGKGYTVITVNYSVAPGAKYPKPLKQVATALRYVQENADRLHVDVSQFFLAGDSAGAQMAAQLANIISVPSYASAIGVETPMPRTQLAGVLLFCGAYDLTRINLDGEFGGFLKTVLWAYSGTKNFMTDPKLATVSVTKYVTSDFPPMFITGGNGDPLTPQSRALATAAAEQGVYVDSLFFADDHDPPLPHEYQLNLDVPAGQLALDRAVAFLAARTDTVGRDSGT